MLTLWRTSILALGLFAILAAAAPSHAQVAIGVAVTVAPPELPVYDQPPCPGDDYLWTPGYWDWDADDDDYFWVPGTWVLAPEPGFFWTPGYWAWRENGYFWTAGYWGPVIGFYGGINYGFGYFGTGFVGGRWEGGHFFYNRSVWRVDEHVVHNVYNERVNERVVTRVSFNGGNGGVNARATPQQEAAARERHVGPVPAQTQHVQEARGNRELRSSVNHGAPAIAATAKPTDFRTGVVKTREAARVNAPANGRPAENATRGNETRPGNEARPGNPAPPNAPGHARDIQPGEKFPAPNTGNPKTDQKYQRQQQQLEAKQEKDRQKLQQQQDKEHQQVQKQQANQARQQQMEQRHQQQSQQLEQRHQQQRQQMQQRQAPRPAPAPHPEPGKPH